MRNAAREVALSSSLPRGAPSDSSGRALSERSSPCLVAVLRSDRQATAVSWRDFLRWLAYARQVRHSARCLVPSFQVSAAPSIGSARRDLWIATTGPSTHLADEDTGARVHRRRRQALARGGIFPKHGRHSACLGAPCEGFRVSHGPLLRTGFASGLARHSN